MQPPLVPPEVGSSASIGVEGSDSEAGLGSEKMAEIEKSDVKESMDVRQN